MAHGSDNIQRHAAGALVAMIPHEVISAHDYTQVTARLVRLLGGNAVAAIVLTRISWRLAPLPEGSWWRANFNQIADETGLTARQVKRAVETLEQDGHLLVTHELVAGAWDRTQSYRIAWADPGTKRSEDPGTERSEAAPSLGPNGPGDVTKRSQDPGTERSHFPVLIDKELQDVKTRGVRGGAAARDPAAIERIVTHLADRIEGNTGRPPTITASWRDAIRLMLDRDNVPENLIHGAIDWAHNSEFWRCNILSAQKLREKYLQMKLQAERERGSSNGHRPSAAHAAAQQALDVANSLAAQERAAATADERGITS